MLNIYVARHGQDEDNRRGILNGRRNMGLTSLGIEEAISVGKKIAKHKISFDGIYSSPLRRALHTAELIAEEASGPEPIIMDDLIERDFGVMTGLPHSSIIPMCSPDVIISEYVDYFLNPENGETFPQLIERGKRVISDLHVSHPEGNILLVTHGDTGMMMYNEYYGLEWMKTLKDFYFHNAELILLSKNIISANTHVFRNSNK
ncbi:MAG: histidine phosphatase family protein [Patescibacteria group bacterium]|jgi:broad specificity phosphatase PhoE